MDYRKFYTELGRLLYAVAMADGEVQEVELHRIYEMVVSDLSDSSLFNSENDVNAYYTEFEFESLMDQNLSLVDALKSFTEFYDQNELLFTKSMKTTTLNAMIAVAEAYEGIVPEEQRIIDEIKHRLNE